MNNILFSVVVPTYNRAKFIHNTISSILVQQDAGFEVIVVDDGGTDNTGEIVKSMDDPRVRYFYKENEERGAARNFGVQQARGNFITFLDSDDYVYPEHLAEARKFISDNPGTKVFHLAYEFKDEGGRVLGRVTQQRPINETIISGNMLSCNGVFAQRSVLLENTFNESRALASLEDWELWIRLASRYEFRHSNTITSVVVQHQQRSVMSKDTGRIREKVDLFCRCVEADLQNRQYYGRRLSRALASANTYGALHIAMAGDRRMSWRYLLEGISQSGDQIFTKRFLVIMMYLLGLRLK